MGPNMVVALGRATVDGHTLFGHATALPEGGTALLSLLPEREHAPGEVLHTASVELPQPRRTHRVLCVRPAGQWGACHGVNEHAVAAGVLPLQTRLEVDPAGLEGTDLVRIVLERGRSARHAVDVLTDLLGRHGQAAASAFLITDATEAFAIETAGRWWVYQEVQELRAQTDVCTVRQDWDRIAPGVAAHVIDRGWWPDDGTKVDFAGVACPGLAEQREALLRWGRSTAHLGQQNGHIDVAFVRHLLGGRLEEPDEVDTPAVAPSTALVTSLGGDAARLRVVWCSLGPPALGLAFPLFLEATPPPPFTSDCGPDAVGADLRRLCDHLEHWSEGWDTARDALARLQARFDQEAEEFAAEHAPLAARGEAEELKRRGGLFGEHCLEQFREVCAGLQMLSRADHGLALSR